MSSLESVSPATLVGYHRGRTRSRRVEGDRDPVATRSVAGRLDRLHEDGEYFLGPIDLRGETPFVTEPCRHAL